MIIKIQEQKLDDTSWHLTHSLDEQPDKILPDRRHQMDWLNERDLTSWYCCIFEIFATLARVCAAEALRKQSFTLRFATLIGDKYNAINEFCCREYEICFSSACYTFVTAFIRTMVNAIDARTTHILRPTQQLALLAIKGNIHMPVTKWFAHFA